MGIFELMFRTQSRVQIWNMYELLEKTILLCRAQYWERALCFIEKGFVSEEKLSL